MVRMTKTMMILRKKKRKMRTKTNVLVNVVMQNVPVV